MIFSEMINALILEGLGLLSSWGQGSSVPLIILDGGVACDWSKDQITRSDWFKTYLLLSAVSD